MRLLLVERKVVKAAAKLLLSKLRVAIQILYIKILQLCGLIYLLFKFIIIYYLLRSLAAFSLCK